MSNDNICKQLCNALVTAAKLGTHYIDLDHIGYYKTVEQYLDENFAKETETYKVMAELKNALSVPGIDIQKEILQKKSKTIDDFKLAANIEINRTKEILKVLGVLVHKSEKWTNKISLRTGLTFKIGGLVGTGTKQYWEKAYNAIKNALSQLTLFEFTVNEEKDKFFPKLPETKPSKIESIKPDFPEILLQLPDDSNMSSPPPPPPPPPPAKKEMSKIQKLFKKAEEEGSNTQQIKEEIEKEAKNLVKTLFSFNKDKNPNKINLSWMERFGDKYGLNTKKNIKYPDEKLLWYIFMRELNFFQDSTLKPYSDWCIHIQGIKGKLKDYRNLTSAGVKISLSNDITAAITQEETLRCAVVTGVNDAIKIGLKQYNELGKIKKRLPNSNKPIKIVTSSFFDDIDENGKWKENFKNFITDEQNKIKNIEFVEEAIIALKALLEKPIDKSETPQVKKRQAEKEKTIELLKDYIIQTQSKTEKELPLLIDGANAKRKNLNKNITEYLKKLNEGRTTTQCNTIYNSITDAIKSIKDTLKTYSKLNLILKHTSSFALIANELVKLGIEEQTVKNILTIGKPAQNAPEIKLISPVL